MNVLMIVVDDLRPAIHALGDTRAITPNLDRLVRSGVGFTQVHCQHPICTASRASALTGCRPDTTRIHQLSDRLADLNPDLNTLPRHFRAAGYETVALGKVYHDDSDDLSGWSQRLNLEEVYFPTHVLPANRALNRQWAEAAKAGRFATRAPATEAADLPDDAYCDFHVARHAIEQLSRPRDKPLFLAAGFLKPHLPFTCPQRYWDLYDRQALAAAVPNDPLVNPAPETLHNWGELRNYGDMPRDPHDVTPEQRAELIHGYYACVSFLDAQIGRLLDALDAQGLGESTLVCLWADHGLVLGEYRMWAKHTLLDAATRVPLIFRDPRNGANGQTCDRIVELLDLFPTLTDLCGLPTPPGVEGKSLRPLLQNPAGDWDDVAFSQYPRGGTVRGRSVRTPRYRYTRWTGFDDPSAVQEDLFDFSEAPVESVNHADDPAYAPVKAELAATLARGRR